MDPLGAVIARLDDPIPLWADRLRWRRDRRHDAALRAVDAFVAPGAVVVDIGAARGHFSSRMLDLVGPHGAVHAFEPNPIHQHRLQRLASDGRLRVHPVALSDHADHAMLRIPVLDGQSLPGLASLEDRNGIDVDTVEVATARLDDVLDPSSPVTFIKCDVEGHEHAVFRGAQEVLTRHRPNILVEIEERHRSGAVSTIFAHFSALGYEGWAVFPDGLRPVDEFALERDQLSFLANPPPGDVMPEGYVHNFVFVRPGTDVRFLMDIPSRQSAGSTGT